ncbi:repetitive organellar protein-like [Battus philenor]|uniref:repetitive organellar protein-like n=1 Tax=Battus philenor TaxID=42288 RepID=UPI0035D0F7F3
MKFGIIFSVWIVLAHGSLFGEFESVMSSLKNGLQKLITDVVTDVKDTFDCTVIAVETALSINTFKIPNSKCNGVANERHDNFKIFPNEDNKKELALSVADTTVGNKQRDALSGTDKENQPNVKFKFIIDKESLQNVNIFLQKESEKMTINFREEFRKMEFNQKSVLDSILKYLNLLHNVQGNGRNDSELSEVRRILDGTSGILKLNIDNRDTNEDKFNKIIKMLNANTNQGKDKEENILKIADNKPTCNNSQSNSYASPTTVKTIFNVLDNALDKTSTSKPSNESTPTTYEEKIKEMEDSISNAKNVDHSDYELFFGDKSDNGGTHKETLDEVTKLLEESRRTNSILNNFFATADKSGSNVFDDQELF